MYAPHHVLYDGVESGGDDEREVGNAQQLVQQSVVFLFVEILRIPLTVQVQCQQIVYTAQFAILEPLVIDQL